MITENNIVTCNENDNGKVELNGGDAPAGREHQPGHSRNGKIARLPLAVRQELNLRLQDGRTGRELLAWLNGLPEVRAVLADQFEGQAVSEMNMSRWRQGGYRMWQAEQQALGAVARLAEQFAGLKEADKDGLTDQMTLVLKAKMAVELERLDGTPDGAQKSKIWRELIGMLVLLRRGDIQGERLVVEREKIGLRRHIHQKEIEEKFWAWAEDEKNRAKILERLLTPEQHNEEVARRNAETQREMKEILGIRWGANGK